MKSLKANESDREKLNASTEEEEAKKAREELGQSIMKDCHVSRRSAEYEVARWS